MDNNIQLNGETQPLTETSLIAALSHWGYTGDYFAVAINQLFIPRSDYEKTVLTPGDSIEILTPMQGG